MSITQSMARHSRYAPCQGVNQRRVWVSHRYLFKNWTTFGGCNIQCTMDQKQDGLVVEQQKQLNGVSYESLPETTIAVSRTHERQYFQKNEYSPQNNEAIVDFNTGSKFINTRRSYLTFKVKGNTAGTITSLGKGSALNFISRVVITSRSGTELSRCEDYNILMAKELRYGCPADYLTKWADLIGFGKEADDTLETPIGADGIQYVIPLEMVSSFFVGDGKTLLPPQLAAGLRVQLTFAPFAQAVAGVSVLTPPTSYSISDISVQCSTTMMVDSWQRQLAMESARDGLTYSYPEWHASQSATTGTSVSIEVRKAVARALSAYVVTKSLPDLVSNDNMKSENYGATTSFEWRLGSMYPTQQPIKNPAEAYFIAQSMVDGGVLDCKRPNNVSYKHFVAGDGIMAVSLERNDVALNGVLNIGGLPSNNSRVLGISATMPVQVAARTHHVFLKHLRVCKAFQDNVVIAE